MKKLTWRHAAVVALAPALVLGLATTADAAAGARAGITDPVGDVYDDEDEVADAPYADIVTADGALSGRNLVLKYTTAKVLHPVEDPNWDSDWTYTDVLLDTNADGEEDFDVEYAVYEGELYVDVYKVDDQEDPPVLCTGTAEFTNGTHVATVPLDCLGAPRRVGYRVETVYDMNVDDPESLAAYDFAPQTGFADAG